MTITYHTDLEQGSDEWLEARRGIITASEMSLLLTPTMKIADNDKVRAHVWELLAQRVTGYIEPRYISDDMMRGIEGEPVARGIYANTVAVDYEVSEVGFITNDEWGFTIGYSPDALVGDRGLWECKAPRQKKQIETIVTGEVPSEHVLQLQAGLMVSKRDWIDFSSYHGGMYMPTFRVYPDPVLHQAILEAGTMFEAKIAERMAIYEQRVAAGKMVLTERTTEQEMF
jgi:hypothetical protein